MANDTTLIQLTRRELNNLPQVLLNESLAQTELIHGDFTIDKVLVRDGEITGLIDWSGGAFADPRYDTSLAIRPKPNVFQDQMDVDLFFKGYGNKIITYDFIYFAEGLYEFF